MTNPTRAASSFSPSYEISSPMKNCLWRLSYTLVHFHMHKQKKRFHILFLSYSSSQNLWNTLLTFIQKMPQMSHKTFCWMEIRKRLFNNFSLIKKFEKIYYLELSWTSQKVSSTLICIGERDELRKIPIVVTMKNLSYKKPHSRKNNY